MNLRDYKKDVEYFVGEFIDDCTNFMSLNPSKATDEMTEIIDEAVSLYNELRDKANVKLTGKKNAYFTSLRKQMLSGVDALYEKLSKIVTDSKTAE